MTMIPRSQPLQQPPEWQTLLAEAVTDPAALLEILELPSSLLPGAIRAARQFRLRVPHGFIARMQKQDPRDPLLRQVLPLDEELVVTEGYSTDPLAEGATMPVPGLLHKYQGRVLFTLTGACAVNCRYCFRRHYPYATANPIREHWQSSLDYLYENPQINEVILSGGDPLTLPNHKLLGLIDDLTTVPHLESVRIHSRVPVVIPERVDARLIEGVTATRLRLVVVIHCNHANEIDDSVAYAMRILRTAGTTLLNQSVLLRGVNDDVASQVNLSRQLFAAGVLPYYLHQLDPVQGAAHFAVDDSRAKELIAEMRRQLPGYLLPRLVRETPQEPAKTPL